MQSLSRRPAPPLDAFVERIWTLADAPPHARERILPSGTQEMVFNLFEDEIRIYDPDRPEHCRRHSGAVVSGAFPGPILIDTLEHRSIVGVHFRPGGAFRFLGLPLGEIAGVHVDLEVLWGAPARSLRGRLQEARSPGERLDILEATLRRRLALGRGQRGLVAFAVDWLTRGSGGVKELVARTGLSHRRFLEVFTANVGLTPKVFGSVQRFQRVLRRTRDRAAPSWAEVALDCGYFDQSHLVRDFASFSGLTPTEYARQRTEQVLENHVPLPDEGFNSIQAGKPERS